MLASLLVGCRPTPSPPAGTAGAPPSYGATAGGAARPLAVPADARPATVDAHVDGDTVWLRGTGEPGPVPAGGRTKVRILEINTPEVFGTAECFGPQASEYAVRRLPVGSTVWVAADREARDRYGRLLLYLWTAEGVFYDEAVLRDGYARALLVEPNDRFITTIRAAEDEARRSGRGLWGSCR